MNTGFCVFIRVHPSGEHAAQPLARRVARLLSGQQRLEGREATGPIQQAVSPQQDIVSCSRYFGLTVGLSADDIHVSLDQKAIAGLYGRTVEAQEIIDGQKMTLRRPPCARKFVENANRAAGKSPVTSYWKWAPMAGAGVLPCAVASGDARAGR